MSIQIHNRSYEHDRSQGHPQNMHEDVFYSQLPQYSSVIDPDYHIVKSRGASDDFAWHIEEQRTDDKITFDVGYFEPKVRKTDIALFIDTSWTTQVQGLNSHTASVTARLGIPTVVKGPEIGVSIPLSHSAFNTHALVDSVANDGFCEAETILHKGFSRGAMIGFGVDAYSGKFDRQVLYAERDDPCLAHCIFEVKSTEIIDYIQYVPQELIGTARQLGKILLDPRRLRYYHKTIDISAKGLLQIAMTGRPLFGGEAGTLADNIPHDSQMNVLFLKGMPANHRDDFKKRLSGRPGVAIQELDGTHTAAIGRKHVGKTIARFTGLIDQLVEGARPDEIDFTKVHLPPVVEKRAG
jgi:hypothetical protein